MSLYRRVSIRMWGDEGFRALSPAKPNGQTLFVHLLTGPHTGVIPGLSVAGEAQLCEQLGWTRSSFRRMFAEVEARGMAIADWVARLVYLPNGKHHNPPSNPNIVVGWRAAFDDLPECHLKSAAFIEFGTYLEPFKEAFREPFDQPLGHGLPNSSGSGSGSGKSNGNGNGKDPLSPLASPESIRPRRVGTAAATLGWGSIMSAVKAGTDGPGFRDQRVADALERMGGFRRVAHLNHRDVREVERATLRREFLDTYAALP